MTEAQFNELRNYMDGPVDMGYKPPASLRRSGWLRCIAGSFYEITDAGRRAMDAKAARWGAEA